MTIHPLISVVLPAFNAEKHIADAVKSILNQTFQDFELIVINDGSTDSTISILENLANKDKRIKLITRENKGIVASLNEGIDVAAGGWIARMDADDIALPNRFACQLECLRQTGADICGGAVQRFGVSDKRIFRPRLNDEAIKMQMLFSCPFAHPTVMMRAALARQLRYDAQWEMVEDYDLWERAAHAGWRMANVPEVLLLYRVHGSQISIASSVRQLELALQIMRRRWARVFKSLGVDWNWVEELLKLSSTNESIPNMDAIDALLINLLKRCDGEAIEVVLSQATHSYLRAAADCPDIVSRWSTFCSTHAGRNMLSTKIMLWFLRMFRIRLQNADKYLIVRKFYRVLIG